jgi:hypothetical protein
MFGDIALDQPATSSNVISEDTGELDVRFALWRQFCAENGLAVETLPSELSEEQKVEWQKLKAGALSETSES